MSARFHCIALVAAALWLGPAAAQDDAPEVVSSYVSARAIEKPAPRYPFTAARDGREGWVIVSYVVSADGAITEPMIEDSSGNEDFEGAALAMLDDWKYEPARLDGEPVAQSMTKTRILFTLDRTASGAGRNFVRKYREIDELIDAGDYETAEDMMADLQYSERQNLYEDAWFWWLKYRYLEATGETETPAARDYLRKAIGYEEDYLAPDLFVAAAQRLYALQVRALDLSGAINTFERLQSSSTAKRSDYYEELVGQLAQNIEAIRGVIDGPGILEVTGLIGEHGYWVHDLLRRSFALAEIDGEVEVVDLHCERGTTRYASISEGNTWTVPDSWGDCGVYIKGTEGTTFKFHEYPPA